MTSLHQPALLRILKIVIYQTKEAMNLPDKEFKVLPKIFKKCEPILMCSSQKIKKMYVGSSVCIEMICLIKGQ